jgi:hypothetical protein
VIEGPDVHRLVGCGLAEPADDECAAMFSDAQITAAKQSGHPMLMQQLAERVTEEKDASIAAETFGGEDDDDNED